VAQLEATIRPAQTLLKEGLNDEAMNLLTGTTEDQLNELCNSNLILHAIVS